jgi:23S rRNA (adenine2503-C2)-methyltransferase
LAARVEAPGYRAEQVFRWLHAAGVEDLEAMSDVPKRERERLRQLASIQRLELAGVRTAADGTRKLALRAGDGETVESVLIPNDDRGPTLCVSSQVGCALSCRFCATASLGFARNLDTWEIVDQFARAARVLADERPGGPGIANVVYMGMGEPLHNFNPVKRSIEILSDPAGPGLSPRRITVSTAGLVPAIERFGREEIGRAVGLAVSLNATTDAVRDEVMPINRRWNIAQLLQTVRGLPGHRRRDLTFEYVLLAGVNDSDDDARRLARLVGDLRAHVNAIPFNPHPHAPYRRPPPDRIARFVDLARADGLRVYLRTPRGDDIAAACGQLALDAGAAAPRDPC